MEISLTPLDDLAAALQVVDGIATASTDPARVRTPGVWVEFTGLTLDPTYQVEGYTLDAALRLVVADNGQKRSDVALAQLLGLVLDVDGCEPVDVIRPVGVVLPASETVLPGLSVPIALLCTQE